MMLVNDVKNGSIMSNRPVHTSAAKICPGVKRDNMEWRFVTAKFPTVVGKSFRIEEHLETQSEEPLLRITFNN